MPTARSTISIALCTYNGQDYLSEQWKSLLAQDQLPDEVIICDDQSTDNTWVLLQELAAQAPFEVRLVKNPVQLGYNKNFEKALSLCTGDLIFICDQDDYWLPAKIRTLTDYMQANPETQVAFNNARVVDEELKDLHKFFWKQVRFDELAKARWKAGEAMNVMLEGNRMMGCATVIRRSFLATLLPIPASVPGYIYDGWLALVAAACNVIDFIDQPLQFYRIHTHQQVGVTPGEVPPRVRLRDRFSRDRTIKLQPLVNQRTKLETIYQLLKDRLPASAPGLEQLRKQLEHYIVRSTLPTNRLARLKPVFQHIQLGNYQRYADPAANRLGPYLAALGDLLE